MVGHDPAFLLAHDPVLLLLADQNDLHGLKQIRLADHMALMLYRIDGRLIDHVRQIRTDSA